MNATSGQAHPTIDQQYVQWMGQALDVASRALASGDVPVGALVFSPEGEVLGTGHNVREAAGDPTAHAEVIAIREAARALGRWRLSDCALYVTLEPCAMCAGAAVLARIALVVFGAPDEKAGAVKSRSELLDATWMNHHPRWRYYPQLRDQIDRLLGDFFDGQRKGRSEAD